jgi:3-hydroxybutyryl-CoA dehydratase
MERQDPVGMWFEDYVVGAEFKSPGRTITETDLVMFSGLTGDYNSLHTDAEYCKGDTFGERITHGMLGLSYAVGLASRFGMLERTVLAFLGLEWKFRAPIKIGDTVHVELTVVQTRVAGSGQGIVVLEVVEKNQRDEDVQRGKWTVMIKRKERN